MTHGGSRAKRFDWAFRNDYVIIKNENGRQEEYSLTEVFAVLGWLTDWFGADWFPLANNVKKLGQDDEAQKIISMLGYSLAIYQSKRFAQNVLLYMADIESVIGRRSEALTRAREALDGDLNGLQSKNSAGMYGRWSTALSLKAGLTAEAQQLLNSLCANMKDYDRLDQVELECARVWLNRRIGILDNGQLMQMETELETMPSAVSDQLRRMGFLD